jgi:drug/metabolite transporter (DMT)-like permease
MRDFGAVTSSNWHLLLSAIADPWIIVGICFLIGFFCTYITALSWADLTYVLPATAISYVFMALLAKIFLHENVTVAHWAGIVLITVGVGFVATGPSLTVPAEAVVHRGSSRGDA